MEEALRIRVELTGAALQRVVARAENILKLTGETGADLDDILKIKQELLNLTSKLKEETLRYIERTPDPSPQVITISTNLEMKAEGIFLEICGTLPDDKPNASKSELQLDTQTNSAKLPKLTLPIFEGDILKWHDFWDHFEASVHQGRYSDAVKMAYLVSSLKGPALHAVEGLGSSNANYSIALDTLKRRYGGKSQVIDAHYSALIKEPPAKESAADCRHTLNNIEKNMRVLQSLGEDTNSNALRSTLLSKFPEKVMFQLNMALKEDSTVSAIRKQLDNIITAMELSQTKDTTPSEEKTECSTEALHVRDSFKSSYLQNSKPGSRRTYDQQSRTTADRRGEKRKAEANNAGGKRNRLSCIFCSGAHYGDKCDSVQTPDERMKKLENRCYKCFAVGHLSRRCLKKITCRACSGPHNTALCRKQSSGILVDQSGSEMLSTESFQSHNRKSFLQTATARILSKDERLPCRILLDSGSQRSYMTTRMARILALPTIKEDLLMIYTFGSDQPIETRSPAIEITIETRRGIQKKMQVNVIPNITDRIPVPDIPSGLVDLVADDGSGGPGIDILIGNDYYFSFITGSMNKVDEDLWLVDTEFGWILSGRLAVEDQDTLAVVTYHQRDPGYPYFSEPDLPLQNMDITFLWSLENIGITDSSKATREDEAVHHFNDTVQYEGGRYYVKWPWTQFPPDLPTNYGLAYGRLKGLVQRSDIATLQEYDDILREQCESGIIEVVEVQSDTRTQTVPPIHYLPHHIVRQAGKRGRIVYDASARLTNEQSLNQCLYRGPCMLQDLTALLLSFRMNKVGLVADVEKAFLQVGLQPDDRDVTRFLWVKDINKPVSDDNLIHLRFSRVPFGIISSPFVLTATIRYHLSKTNQDLLQRIADKCYVDNLVTGAKTTQEACELYTEARSVFQELSMNIRDWTSNDKATLDEIPEQYQAKHLDPVKVLGLLWNIVDDSLQLKDNENIFKREGLESVNKREILRIIASIYDPCGYVSPLIMPAKLLLQELWLRKYKWETSLPDDLLSQWEEIVTHFSEVKTITLPRYAGPETGTTDAKYQLHCFTDASLKSYAAVAYLRVEEADSIKVTLLMSKARVAPLKDLDNLKIPRLELMGYLIGNRLLGYLVKTLALPNVEQFLWTDSLVVLSWIKSQRLLPPFVARRVEEIKKSTGVQRCYIQTDENPADIATRPETWKKRRELWFQGPAFLAKFERYWPVNMKLESHLASFSAVAKGLDPVQTLAPMDQEVELDTEGDIQVPGIIEEGSLEQEIPVSRTVPSQVREIIKLQSSHFPEEYRGKITHLTRNLGLFKDVDGLLRSKGRLAHADLSYETKHPILLPRDCEFTTNIIKAAHEQNYHVGVPHTLSILREHYWIPQGRQQVKKVISKCPQCVKHGGGPFRLPSTPALPAERVKYADAFEYTGIDYFGPMYVRTSSGKEKRWICLFTCLVVRAIHLEVVLNLSAEECLLALRRFVSIRKKPALIMSDNALQFKLTSEVLTSEYCKKNSIAWKFIPQLAPWHGAVYERLIGVVKNCLKRTLEKHLLEDSQLSTVIKEVETVVNTRPLTYVGTDVDYILKPADFLSLGKCLPLDPSLELEQPLPPGTITKENLIEGWKRGQNLLKEFKKMFIGQYLLNLRERYRHSPKQPRVKSHDTPAVGDVVQIKGESKNRELWKVGNISELIKGPDGDIRVAKVKVGNTEFTRSIGHLYPLEADIESDESARSTLDTPNSPVVSSDPAALTPNEEEDQVSGRTPREHEQEVMEVEELDTPRSIGGVQEEEMDIDPMGTTSVSYLPTVPEATSESPLVVTRGGPDPSSSSACDGLAIQDARVRRNAALRAREKIAEWTSQLFALL